MDKWIVGIKENQKVDYIVNFEVSKLSSWETPCKTINI